MRNYVQKPKKMDEDYIVRITNNAGEHRGVFQLVQFHYKKHDIYSTQISDGFFKLKVIFMNAAGEMLTNQTIKLNDIIYAGIHNYSYDQGIFLVREVKQYWSHSKIIGNPKVWRLRKANANRDGSSIIQAEQPKLISIQQEKDKAEPILEPAENIVGKILIGNQENKIADLTQSIESCTDKSKKTEPIPDCKSEENKEEFDEQEQLIQLLDQFHQRKIQKSQKMVEAANEEFQQLFQLIELSKKNEQEQKTLKKQKEDQLLEQQQQLQLIELLNQYSHDKYNRKRSLKKQQNIQTDCQLLESLQQNYCQKYITNYNSLAQLSPNIDNWIIKVRLIGKTSINNRKFNNIEISSFSCMFQDQLGNLMEAVVNDIVKYDQFKQNIWYEISKGMIRQNKLKKAKSNGFMLELGKNAIVKKSTGNLEKEQVFYNITLINEIENISNDYIVDVIGIVKEVTQTTYIKENITKLKKCLILIDPIHESQIDINDFSNNIRFQPCTVITVYNLKINQFKDKKTLIVGYNTILRQHIKQDNQLVRKMLLYCNQDFLISFYPKIKYPVCTMSQLKALQQKQLSNSKEQIKICGQIEGRLEFSKTSLYYIGCEVCRKKLQPNNHCLKCQTIRQPVVNYLLRAQLIDNIGSIFLIVDPHIVNSIFNITAAEMYEFERRKNINEMRKLYRILDNISNKRVRCQVSGSLRVYNNTFNINYTLRQFQILDDDQYLRRLLDRVEKYRTFI